MPKRPYLHERLSKADPNYELVKNNTLKAWVDSHGLVADGFAGKVSLLDYVERCVNTFSQGAQIHVGFQDSAPTSDRCEELDRMAGKSVRRFRNSLSPESKRLGKASVRAAIEELSGRVNEIAARSKQQICEAELARSAEQQPSGSGTVTPAGDKLASLPDHAELPEAARDLIAAGELDARSILEGFERDSDSLWAQAYAFGVSPSDIDFAPGNNVLKLAGDTAAHGRAQAAYHLFRITAGQYWTWLQPDIERFMPNLVAVWQWAFEKFQVSYEIPESIKRDWKSWALRQRAAAQQPTLQPRLVPPADVSIPFARRNRLIVRYLASDRVADIKVPRVMYAFHAVFPQAAQAKVLAARFRAEQLVHERRGSIQDFAAAEELLIEFILTVFVAFAEEGFKLGIQGRLTVQDLESECLRFLRAHALAGGLLDNMLIPPNDHSEIPDDVQHKIESTDQWKQYRRILEDVALTQSRSPQELTDAPPLPDNKAPGRPSPKELVDTAKRQPKRSYEKFAAHIGISKDTMYAITKETRWVSDESYSLVAQACHCKPEDLHPRDIPRPQRRR